MTITRETLRLLPPPRFARLSVLAHEGSGEAPSVFRLGADELGFTSMAILPREQCSVAAFSKAVAALANCYPLLLRQKARIRNDSHIVELLVPTNDESRARIDRQLDVYGGLGGGSGDAGCGGRFEAFLPRTCL